MAGELAPPPPACQKPFLTSWRESRKGLPLLHVRKQGIAVRLQQYVLNNAIIGFEGHMATFMVEIKALQAFAFHVWKIILHMIWLNLIEIRDIIN